MVGVGRIGLKNDSNKFDNYVDILRRAGKNSIEVQSELKEPEENEKMHFQSWGAHFCEVKIDPLIPRVQVTRWVSVMNCGRVVRAKPARSQILGGAIMGIGMALTEETAYDPQTGLPATANLADYHVPDERRCAADRSLFCRRTGFRFQPDRCARHGRDWDNGRGRRGSERGLSCNGKTRA